MKKTFLLLMVGAALLATSCGPAADGRGLARKADKCMHLSMADSIGAELTPAQRDAYADCVEEWQDDFRSQSRKYQNDSAAISVFNNTFDSILISIDSTYDPQVVRLLLGLSDPEQIRATAL